MAKDVHDAHCCFKHGCVYQDEDCTVASGINPGIFCEECQNEPYVEIEEYSDCFAIVAGRYFNDPEETRWSFSNKEPIGQVLSDVLKFVGISNVTVISKKEG